MDDFRAEESTLHRYRFGTAEFDEASFELTVGGLAVELERRPLEVLSLLLRHAGEVVTKEELLDTVWAGRITVENVLANAVAKLRKALGETGAEQIRTHARIGYRLVGPVQRVAVGRRLVNRLDLKAGAPVPGRTHFILKEQLAGTSGSEVWLARHDKTGELRVYKFSPDGVRLSALKREATLARVLRESLGEREDFARVIDWNFETAPFFLECEYGGKNLLDWAKEDGNLAALDEAGRLDLALQAIDAVAAAHECGVLHKDLKPANLLIAPRKAGGWQVRIADFGVGSLIELGRLEQLGITPLGFTIDPSGSSSPGTPLYIAPEVISGQAPSVRSDVYALGVILYQLLSGDMKKPLASGWEQEIADPLLRDDIAEAAHGNAAQRMASASIMAERLRTLDARRADHAASAARAAEAEAARQELDRVRARRPWFIATMAALAIGLGASMWLYAQTARARQTAETEAARAEATGGFLRDLLVNADPYQPDGGGDVTVKAALDRAAATIPQRFADDPATEASIQQTAGEIYTGLADYEAGAVHKKRAADLLTELYGADDPRTIIARYRQAETLANGSRFEEALEVLNAADDAAAPLLPANAAVAFAKAQTWGRYSLIQADTVEAAKYLEEAVRLLPQIAPDDVETAYHLQMDLSQVYSRVERQDEAIALLEGLQDASWADKGISRATRARARLYYGAALFYGGYYEASEPVLQDAIIQLTDVFGPEASQVIEAQSSLLNLYATSGAWDKAVPLVGDVRQKMCTLHGDAHLICQMTKGNEAVFQWFLGDWQGAIDGLEPIVASFREQLGPDSPGVHVLAYYLAMAKLDAGQADEAAGIAAQLDPIKLAAGSPGDGWADRVDGLKAMAAIRQGDCTGGLPKLEAAITAMRSADMQSWILRPYETAMTDAHCSD